MAKAKRIKNVTALAAVIIKWNAHFFNDTIPAHLFATKVPGLSKRLQRIKKYSIRRGFVTVDMDVNLAQELMNLHDGQSDLKSEFVWFWAFNYYSKTAKLYDGQQTPFIWIDKSSDTIKEGIHKIAGFLTSGKKSIKTVIVFASPGDLLNR